MIQYENKYIVNDFKIGNNSYKVDINQVHTEEGPKVSIKVNVGSSAFHINISSLEAIEIHTALTEVINTLVTITHVHYGTPVQAVMAPCINNNIHQ